MHLPSGRREPEMIVWPSGEVCIVGSKLAVCMNRCVVPGVGFTSVVESILITKHNNREFFQL